MASGLFLNPNTLLRLTPLVSSTASLWFSWDQHVAFSNFVHPSLALEANGSVLQKWWIRTFDNQDILRVLFPVTVTAVSAVANLRKYGKLLEAKGSWVFYAAGAALAAAHVAFVPAVMYKIESIVKENGKGDAVGVQKQWLRVHTIRSLTVDLGAWLACLVAVTKTVS